MLGAVEDWARAWSRKDVEKLSLLLREGLPHAQGRAARELGSGPARAAHHAAHHRVEVVDPKVTLTDPNHATVAFKQTYRADAYRSSGRKTLQMVRQGDRWLIQQETITFR